MQNRLITNDIARVGSAYTAFEAMFIEVHDNVNQLLEELEFLENQILTVGTNIKQLCIDFVQEMFAQPFDDTKKDESEKLLLAQNTDEADRMLKQKEGIDDYYFEKEPCDSDHSFHSCSEELTEAEDSKLPSEVSNSTSISENNSKENQVQLEAFDNAAANTEDSSLLLGSPIFDDVDKCTAKTFDVLLSDIENSVHPCGRVASDTEVSSSSTSPRSIGSGRDSVDENSNFGVGLYQYMRMYESCIVKYGADLSSQSQEAQKIAVYQSTSGGTLTEGQCNSLEHNEKDGYRNPASGGCLQQEEEASESLYDEFSESDWEII